MGVSSRLRVIAQTATEYLIIVAVVIIIALVVIGVLSGIPESGANANKQTNDAELQTSIIGTESYTMDNNKTTLVLQNNFPERVQLTSIIIGGVSCDDSSLPYSMSVGKKHTFVCDNVNTTGETYNTNYSITYSELGGGSGTYTLSLPDLIGTASNSVSGGGGGESFEDPEGILDWNITWGGEGDDLYGPWFGFFGEGASEIFIDESDNIYVTGYEQSFAGADYGLGGKKDILILKFDSGGNYLWNTTWGNDTVAMMSGNDYANGIVGDSLGNIYVTGVEDSFVGADYGPGNWDDIILLKINSFGNQLWNVSLGNISNDAGNDVVVDSENNIYVVGTYFTGSTRNTVFKFNSNGVQLLNFTWGNTNTKYSRASVLDNSNNLYVTGYVTKYGGDNDIFLEKFNSSGSHLWNSTWGGSLYDWGNDVTVDNFGNVYVVGQEQSFSGADYGVGGQDDLVVLKFDSDGSLIWNVTFGGAAQDVGTGVVVDNSGNIYVTGFENSFSGADYGPGGSYDKLLVKFDSDGNQLWNKTWGGAGADYGRDIAINSSGHVITIGESSSYGNCVANGCTNIVLAGWS